SGTMEGKWTSPSPHSEESSTLDLPSICDVAENFLPSHTTENSEEPCFFVDTPPSPPTGVSAVPADKEHVEEMVTQCIVEVLSNALSKPNAPPINPECKEILRKSGKNDRDKNEDKQLEMRHLKDPAENEERGPGSVEKEQSQPEMESKMHMKGSDEKKLGWEEDKSEEEEDGHDISVHEAHEDEHQMEEMKHHEETREDEDSSSREDKSRESRHRAEEAERDGPNEKPASAAEFPGGSDQRSMGWARSEERRQDKRIHEGEEREAERSERDHHESQERDSSRQRDREESAESEEAAEEKQSYKPKRYHRKHRMDDPSEKGAHSGENEKVAEESNVEKGRPWDRRNHHQQHRHEEAERHREEKGGYQGRHSSGEVEEKRDTDRGGEEHGERWQQSEESREEESKRHHESEESHEKWQEERRHHEAPHEAGRHRPEGRTYGEGEEDMGSYHGGGSKEEQQQRGAERRRLRDSEEMQKLSAGESRGQLRRHDSTEDRASVEQQRYPGTGEEEEGEEKHQSSDQIENEENTEEGRYAEREQSESRFPAENERSSAALSSPLRSLLRWDSHRFERKANVGEQLLQSREEARPTLSEKNLFPEYDYDWWEKKQILNALKHGRTEKRNLGKINRFDVKRQYNRMDQLAQLLNYRKKSAEFPELYDSREDLKKHHGIRNDRGNLTQRPLTEEEEKELENLAAMDLELQKIAEKLNDNRRG
ncbi:SCG1 protein, partial [Nothocercus nigrocapillus]|nr:SCG1 protein [Nothocercus nigrocapillus]